MRKRTVLSIAAAVAILAAVWTWRGTISPQSPPQKHHAEASEKALQITVPVMERDSEPAIAGGLAEGPVETKHTLSAAADPGQATTLDGLMKREQALLRDPQYREARRDRRFIELATRRPDLAAVLQISQEKADALLRLVVEQELQEADEALPNPTTDEEAGARDLETLRRSQTADAKVIELIGEVAAHRWKDYEASFQARQLVYELRADLSAGPEPLRDDQIESLVSAVHDEQAVFADERRTFLGSLTWTPEAESESRTLNNDQLIERTVAANTRIRAAAASILTSRQLGNLDQLLQTQLEATRAQIRLERAQAKADAH